MTKGNVIVCSPTDAVGALLRDEEVLSTLKSIESVRVVTLQDLLLRDEIVTALKCCSMER